MKTLPELMMTPVVYKLPGSESVMHFANLTYSDVDNPNLLLDVYTPAGLARGERRPVVVFIHGGAEPEDRVKDWGIYQSWGRLAAAEGMIGVTFTHRLGYPEPFLDEASADLRSAIAYLRANGEAWNADATRICLAAYSAGGQLLDAPMREKPDWLTCIVAFYAVLEMGPSPIPMFIARAGKDAAPGLNEAMDRFIASALAANAPVAIFNHPAGEHGFDNQNDDERSREIIGAALAFMKTHLISANGS